MIFIVFSIYLFYDTSWLYNDAFLNFYSLPHQIDFPWTYFVEVLLCQVSFFHALLGIVYKQASKCSISKGFAPKTEYL